YCTNSAMDGFAVVAEDVAGATPDQPVVLEVVETIEAGQAPTRRIERGKCARIMTGAIMPEGADS
ncbi:MAG: molybdopterin molybdenumtransferase MoeA, partial [Gammaproteobacteria bacterium]|nr:molybdopterin molybdenumtransferase MoeA [Gammaproteobacteria bacterium]